MISLLGKIKELFGRISKGTIITDQELKEYLREFQRILISSDVNVRLVLEITRNIEERFKKEKELPGISPKEHLVQIMYDELVSLLGGERYVPRMEPHKILLVGVYGQGKTTTAGKLGRFYAKRGFKTALLGVDIYRPAAFEQLKQIGEKAGLPVFGGGNDVRKILEENKEVFKKYDIVIIDSAGRDSLSQELMDEIKHVYEFTNPEEVFLVISADIGQTAKTQAEQFNSAVPLTGVIVTKADSSGKAGGAISACAVAGVPVAFIGTGEHLDDFEIFDAKKYIGRLLGYPDLEALLEKVREAAQETELSPEDIFKKEYTLETFYKQLETMSRMGSLRKVVSMAGLSLPESEIQTSEEKLKAYKYILDSMRCSELKDPSKITSKRITQIAYGSGRTEAEVRELLKQYRLTKKFIEKAKKGKRGFLKGFRWK